MNGIPPARFYGRYKSHKCPNQSLILIADQLQTSIFKSLRFPVREKATKTIRLQIRKKDAPFLNNKSLEDILKTYCTSYDDSWNIRFISEEGDANMVVSSRVTIRKLRSDKHYVQSGGEFVEVSRHHGMELVVKVVRARRVGERAAM